MGSNPNAPFNWSDPAYQTSRFHKWEKEGDEIQGVIREITSHTFEARGQVGERDYQAAQTFPVLILDTANGEQELTVSSVDLLDKTHKANPQVGDDYYASWVGTAGKKRIFMVKTTKPVAAAAPIDINPRPTDTPTTFPPVDAGEIPF